MPNGDSPATPPSTNAVSPAVDNSEVTNARVEEILLSDARSPFGRPLAGLLLTLCADRGHNIVNTVKAKHCFLSSMLTQ